MPKERNGLLTVPELARKLGVAPATIYRHVRAGNIPVVRVGKFKKFRESIIDAWIEKGGMNG